MKTDRHLPNIVLERWFTHLPEDRRDQLEAGLYLYLGRERSRLIGLPTPDERILLEHVRILRDADQEVMRIVRDLLEASPVGRRILLELAVDELVSAAEWHHPTQVLERPRPRFEDLLAVCRRRLEGTSDEDRPRLDFAIQRLRVAIDIKESARRRRETLARGRRRRRQERQDH